MPLPHGGRADDLLSGLIVAAAAGLIAGVTWQVLRRRPASPSGPDPLLGRTVGGYRLVQKLGEGGMGAVYRGMSVPGAGAPVGSVAIKILRSADPVLQGRFEREARVGSELSHPGVVRVLEWGREGELLYLAMELVRGETLNRRIRPDMPISEAMGIVRQLLEAMVFAHARGCIHRDLKPANVMVTTGGTRVEGGGDFTSSSTAALIAGGDVSLIGHGADHSSFAGLVYTRGDFLASGITLLGAFVGGGPHSTVTLDSANVIQIPGYSKVDLDLTTTSTSYGYGTPQNPAYIGPTSTPNANWVEYTQNGRPVYALTDEPNKPPQPLPQFWDMLAEHLKSTGIAPSNFFPGWQDVHLLKDRTDGVWKPVSYFLRYLTSRGAPPSGLQSGPTQTTTTSKSKCSRLSPDTSMRRTGPSTRRGDPDRMPIAPVGQRSMQIPHDVQVRASSSRRDTAGLLVARAGQGGDRARYPDRRKQAQRHPDPVAGRDCQRRILAGAPTAHELPEGQLRRRVLLARRLHDERVAEAVEQRSGGHQAGDQEIRGCLNRLRVARTVSLERRSPARSVKRARIRSK